MKQIELNVGGKNLIAEVSAFNDKQHVAIAPICEAIGIDTYTQGKKLKNNPQFMPQHILGHDALGREKEMLMLPVEEVGIWLCNINSAKVKETVKDILIAFQRHCQVELHAAITGMAGTDRVAALENQVAALTAQVGRLTDQVGKVLDVAHMQQCTIDHLSKMVQPMAKVEKHIASIGGKFMAVARGTKKMREEMQ